MTNTNELNAFAATILDPNSEMNQVAQNIIKCPQKRDIILQDFLYWVANNQQKTLDAIENGYIKYLYIRIIRINHIGSNTDYQRNWSVNNDIMATDIDIIYREDDLTDKYQFEEICKRKNEYIFNYFEERLFELYYVEGMSHRQIGEHLDIHFTSSHKKITEINERMRVIFNKNK